MKDYLEDFKDFNKEINSSRISSRSVIYKIIILSASIIGFSVSLFSVPVLQSSLNIEKLRLSWYFFLFAIILGFLLLLIEPRINYAKTWKGFQPTEFPEDLKFNFLYKEQFIALCIIFVSLFHPSNLIYNRIYKIEKEKLFKERINFFSSSLVGEDGVFFNYFGKFYFYSIYRWFDFISFKFQCLK